MSDGPLRVGLIGHGAIGSVVAEALLDGVVPDAALVGVLDPPAPHPTLAVPDLDALLAHADVVVEAAGHAALTEYGPAIRRSGTDLLVVSVGALADDELYGLLARESGGRLLFTTGAVGGFDTLRAAMLAGPLDEVSITSTKPSRVLARPWMEQSLIDALERGAERTVAFDGTAREACLRFPESANVTATLSLATIGFDRTRVTIVGDPGAERVRHVIRADGVAGTYELSFENRPSPTNPRTSAITGYSVVRGLQDLRRGDHSFV